jgi:hypothetical protein
VGVVRVRAGPAGHPWAWCGVTVLDYLEVAARAFEPGRHRHPTPGALARVVNPRTVDTPALRAIDQALVELSNTPDGRLIVCMPP